MADITYRKVYDVSVHNGLIDWEQVKQDGTDFVMIRAGYGRNNIDERWVDNASSCVRLGIPFGIYWFSYALNEAMAEQEAAYAVEAVSRYLSYCPIAYDLEYDTVRYAATKGVTIDGALAARMADAFLGRAVRAGYEPWLYANKDYLERMFDASLLQRYHLWYARYNRVPGREDMGMWQYSSTGQVPGITGRVDCNRAYRFLECIPREGGSDTIETQEGIGCYSLSRDGHKVLTLDGRRTNFKIKEFACKDGTDQIYIDRELVRILQQIRDYYDSPVVITSAYRTASHNAQAGGAQSSCHLSGRAADIKVSGISPVKAAAYAESLGVQGIGLYLSFIHVDTRDQKYYWVDMSGGVATFGAGNPYRKPSAGTVLRRGSRGEGVKWLQTELGLEGFALAVDGIYGQATEQAVRAYQERKRLAVDGMAGDITMGHLAG